MTLERPMPPVSRGLGPFAFRSFPMNLRSASLALSTLLLAFPTGAIADEFRLENATLPAPIVEAGKPNVIIEASAAEPIGDGRRFLVAHDKHPALYVIDFATGQIV